MCDRLIATCPCSTGEERLGVRCAVPIGDSLSSKPSQKRTRAAVLSVSSTPAPPPRFLKQEAGVMGVAGENTGLRAAGFGVWEKF
jgi:hypothetical protein